MSRTLTVSPFAENGNSEKTDRYQDFDNSDLMIGNIEENAEKVSTACGTSPPRDFLNEEAHNEKTFSTASTGTSPPPQSISTQVSFNENLCKVARCFTECDFRPTTRYIPMDPKALYQGVQDRSEPDR